MIRLFRVKKKNQKNNWRKVRKWWQSRHKMVRKMMKLLCWDSTRNTHYFFSHNLSSVRVREQYNYSRQHLSILLTICQQRSTFLIFTCKEEGQKNVCRFVSRFCWRLRTLLNNLRWHFIYIITGQLLWTC